MLEPKVNDDDKRGPGSTFSGVGIGSYFGYLCALRELTSITSKRMKKTRKNGTADTPPIKRRWIMDIEPLHHASCCSKSHPYHHSYPLPIPETPRHLQATPFISTCLLKLQFSKTTSNHPAIITPTTMITNHCWHAGMEMRMHTTFAISSSKGLDGRDSEGLMIGRLRFTAELTTALTPSPPAKPTATTTTAIVLRRQPTTESSSKPSQLSRDAVVAALKELKRPAEDTVQAFSTSDLAERTKIYIAFLAHTAHSRNPRVAKCLADLRLVEAVLKERGETELAKIAEGVLKSY
ncbi:hypothetical protein BJ508DRAFT_364357 [Ascobolus immersus RN42]|uniref:Uncharacterized protein n=1 Tax=Ascobolus immersus RN42 TaxID=1160509 RepID=A0A3N4HWH1_ASCIM|nr:hypothetical protein BJ508DRAFT_364357 [Ascobolus immersus RN42]